MTKVTIQIIIFQDLRVLLRQVVTVTTNLTI